MRRYKIYRGLKKRRHLISIRQFKRGIRTFFIILGLIVGPFVFGVLIFNFVALPLWVGKYEEVGVPDICGKPLEQAKRELGRVGLRGDVLAQEFSKLPKGMVISQNPLPGRRVRAGKKIKLSVSRGSEKLKVPWVEGMPLEQACNILRNSRLEAGEIIYEYSNTVEAGYVIRTKPAVDMYVSTGAAVNMYVSQGGLEFSLPDFTGKILKNAQAEAYKLGLKLDIRYVANPSPMGIVISQTPSAGSIGESGDSVELIVGLPQR